VLRLVRFYYINPLNAELNPMCHLLILLGDLTFMGTCIVSISNKMQRYTVYWYLETALHVSGGISTHRQEHIQLYLQHLVFVTLLLLSAAIVEELEPVWACCGWKYHPKHVDQFPYINELCDVTCCWIYEHIGILLGARPILHISRIKVNSLSIFKENGYILLYIILLILTSFVPTFSYCCKHTEIKKCTFSLYVPQTWFNNWPDDDSLIRNMSPL
jgi:hypothetical protein